MIVWVALGCNSIASRLEIAVLLSRSTIDYENTMYKMHCTDFREFTMSSTLI
jgi:hypothetical protein